MAKLDYAFINAVHDEKLYQHVLNKIYMEAYGYTLHDNDQVYSGYHSTIVCRHNDAIIGGISAYFSDRTDRLPMERRGIDLSAHLNHGAVRYAEICRAGVLRAYRKDHVYRELIRRCVRFCVRIGCDAGIWVAKKYHSDYYKAELELMGMSVRTLAVIPYEQQLAGRASVAFDYYLSCCRLTG